MVGQTMTDEMPEALRRKISDLAERRKISDLADQVLAEYERRGVPAEEVDDRAIFELVWAQLSEREREEFLGVSRQQMEEEASFAAFSTILNDLAAEAGEPPLPLVSLEEAAADPDRVERVQDLKRILRELEDRKSADAYWGDDESK
jgi:hypothetical protein